MFLNATMLAGIAGAALPLVLHLLSRARYRNVEWGAMMFLRPDRATESHAARWKELALLGLRMAIVAMLAVALARPVLGAADPSGDGTAAAVIILDRSLSMGYEENGRERMDLARRAVLNILTSLRRNDEAAVVLMPDVPQTSALSTDLQAIASRVAEVRPVQGNADIAEALQSAVRLLEQSRAAHRRLLLVTDRQAHGWRSVDAEFARAWRSGARDRASRIPRFSVVPIGGADAGNVAVDSISVANLPIIRDTAADFEVRVTNFGSIPRTGVTLTLTSSTRQTLYRTTLNLAGGASHTARFSLRFGTLGSQYITARIDGGDLPSDDAMEYAFEVVEPIGVLIISGDERDSAAASRFRGESDFLRLALAPFATSGQTGPDPARVRITPSDDWPQLHRSNTPVVILANVARFTEQQVRQLEQYVYDGGGLIVAPGNLSRVADYSAHLWRDGAGMLPAELESPVAADGSQATSLLGLELSHPIFRFLRGREDPVPSVTIGRYFPVRSTEPQGRVIGRYASGLPFMIEGSYGRGRVLLITTPLDSDWSTLPFSSSYLPMMQSAVRYLAAAAAPRRDVLPGEPLLATITDMPEVHATIDGPGFPDLRMDLPRVGDGFEARYTNTSRPGRYTLTLYSGQQRRQLHFTVRPPRDESNLQSLTDARWTELQRDLGFEILNDPSPQAVAASLAESRDQRELWPILLAGVVVLALLEMGLARFWTHSEGETA